MSRPLVLFSAVACLLVAGDEPTRPLAPSAVAAAPDGTLWIADAGLPGLWRIEPGGRLTIAFRAEAKGRSPLRAIRALAVGREGELYVADSAASDIFRFEAGKPPVPLTDGAFEVPTGLAVAGGGDLVVCDLRLGNVARVPGGGGDPATIARVPAPRGVAIGASGEIAVLSMGPDALLRISPEGEVRPIVKGRPFRFPLALLAEKDGAGYLVSDGYAGAVWSVSGSGEVKERLKGDLLVRPAGLARDGKGALLVADPGAGRVFRVGEDGKASAIGEPP